MDQTLRKRHRQIWIALAILLAILFVAAIMVIPQEVDQDILYQDTESIEIQESQSKDTNQKENNE